MFECSCLPLLIGSLPLQNHREALETIIQYTPDLPLWPQLPQLPKEGMVRQFLDGFPGLRENSGSLWVDTGSGSFIDEMTAFYEELLEVPDMAAIPNNSRFSLNTDTANGFFVLIDYLNSNTHKTISAKGQITGPMTIGISLKDQDGNSIFYDDNFRDMITKLLAMKARWQVEQLAPFCRGTSPLLFIDEPGMVSFGSTALAGVTKEMVSAAVNEVIDEVRAAGGHAGVHICANGDWKPVLQSNAEIISFDAYSFFENFILYSEELIQFIERGGVLCWGIIPTANTEAINTETVESLYTRWQKQLTQLEDLGLSRKQLVRQTLISPSCGTGSLTLPHALKVLSLTKGLSTKIRKVYNV